MIRNGLIHWENVEGRTGAEPGSLIRKQSEGMTMALALKLNREVRPGGRGSDPEPRGAESCQGLPALLRAL